MPVEVQVPADMHDEEIVETFRSSLLEIGAARNNNVQLTEETKANKKGFYEIFKEHLPSSLSADVEWKTNDGGRIKVRDIIALSWIGLSKLELPDGLRVNPNQIYRNKAVCVATFNKLLENEASRTRPRADTQLRSTSDAVKSAMKSPASSLNSTTSSTKTPLQPTMSRRQLREDQRSSGSTIPKKRPTRTRSFFGQSRRHRFFQRPVKYTCPDGFIVPLIYGLRTLLDVDKDGLLVWKTNPQAFLAKHLVEIMKSYRLVIEMAGWDPQKVRQKH